MTADSRRLAVGLVTAIRAGEQNAAVKMLYEADPLTIIGTATLFASMFSALFASGVEDGAYGEDDVDAALSAWGAEAAG